MNMFTVAFSGAVVIEADDAEDAENQAFRILEETGLAELAGGPLSVEAQSRSL